MRYYFANRDSSGNQSPTRLYIKALDVSLQPHEKHTKSVLISKSRKKHYKNAKNLLTFQKTSDIIY